MRGISQAFLVLVVASTSLVGCGGVAVNQDGRTVALTNSLARIGRVRANLPLTNIIPLAKATELPPPLGQYDSYLKLWYVVYPSPLAVADSAPDVFISSVGYFEDQKLTKPAGFSSFRNTARETGSESLFEEEYSKGTRAGEKSTRKQINQPDGSFTADVEKSIALQSEIHKGKELSDLVKAQHTFEYDSVVKGVSVLTKGKMENASFAPGRYAFSATFKDSTGFNVTWSEEVSGPGSFTMTGENSLLPATGTFNSGSGKGTLKFADGSTIDFTLDTKGIKF